MQQKQMFKDLYINKFLLFLQCKKQVDLFQLNTLLSWIPIYFLALHKIL